MRRRPATASWRRKSASERAAARRRPWPRRPAAAPSCPPRRAATPESRRCRGNDGNAVAIASMSETGMPSWRLLPKSTLGKTITSTAPSRYHSQDLFVEPMSEELHRVAQRQRRGHRRSGRSISPRRRCASGMRRRALEDGYGLEQVAMAFHRVEVGRAKDDRRRPRGGRAAGGRWDFTPMWMIAALPGWGAGPRAIPPSLGRFRKCNGRSWPGPPWSKAGCCWRCRRDGP